MGDVYFMVNRESNRVVIEVVEREEWKKEVGVIPGYS